MDFEVVSVDEFRKKYEKPEPLKVSSGTQQTLETKEFHVVDPDTGQVVGYIDAPITYCPGPGCEAAIGKRHPMGYINPLDRRKDKRELWVHMHCKKPTRPWWRSTWQGVVRAADGVKLPWDQ